MPKIVRPDLPCARCKDAERTSGSYCLPCRAHRDKHPPGGRARPTVAEIHVRFLSKIDTSSSPLGCWLWTAGRNRKGYGQFFANKDVPAHRYSWEYVNGPIPEGMLVRHGPCHNRACVNPDHLSLGTDLDNAIDRSRDLPDRFISPELAKAIAEDFGTISELVAKYRLSNDIIRRIKIGRYQIVGEPVPLVPDPLGRGRKKFNDSEIIEIRKSAETQAALARKYQVHPATIERIVNNKMYLTVTEGDSHGTT